MQEIVCIRCPMGCRITIEKDKSIKSGYKIDGNVCKRGENYAIEELENPTRIIPTTVKIKNGFLPRLPVKTDRGVPKNKIFDCMKEINRVEVKAPIKLGDIIIENILNTGVNIVATRSMDEAE